jgi:hypothetical protein
LQLIDRALDFSKILVMSTLHHLLVLSKHLFDLLYDLLLALVDLLLCLLEHSGIHSLHGFEGLA